MLVILVVISSFLIHLVVALSVEKEIKDIELQLSKTSLSLKHSNKETERLKNIEQLIEDLEQKVEQIDSLREAQSRNLNSISQLVKLIPEGVYLESVTFIDGAIEVSGKLPETEAISSLVEQLDSRQLTEKVSLHSVTKILEGEFAGHSRFLISFELMEETGT